MGDPAPLPHEPRAWPQGDRLYGFGRAAALRIGIGVLQLPCGGQGKAAVRPLLKLVSDPSGQEVAREPHRRRHPMKPPPLPAQLEDGQRRESRELLCDVDCRFVHVSARAAFRCGSGRYGQNYPSASQKIRVVRAGDLLRHRCCACNQPPCPRSRRSSRSYAGQRDVRLS